MKQLLVKSIVALSLIASNAVAGNSEGRNSLSQASNSIPIQGDRELTYPRFSSIVKQCMETPAHLILRELGFSSNELTNIFIGKNALAYGKLVQSLHSSQYMSGPFVKVTAEIDWSSSNQAILKLQLENSPHTSNPKNSIAVLENKNILHSLGGDYTAVSLYIPLLTFGRSQVYARDSFGIPLPLLGGYVENIVLQPSAFIVAYSSSLETLAQEKVTTKLKYNSEPFVECIRNELGKNE